MKAITLMPPYAQLAALGLKHYETRKNRLLSSVVGQRVAIHCGKNMRILKDMRKSLDSLYYSERTAQIEFALNNGTRLTLKDKEYFEPQRGCVIATAVIGFYLEMDYALIDGMTPLERACGYWSAGYHAYHLDDIQLLDTPIPARGKQGRWEWTP